MADSDLTMDLGRVSIAGPNGVVLQGTLTGQSSLTTTTSTGADGQQVVSIPLIFVLDQPIYSLAGQVIANGPNVTVSDLQRLARGMGGKLSLDLTDPTPPEEQP